MQHRTPAPHHSARTAPRATAPWGWALAGTGVGLLLVGLWFAPARWLAQQVQQASGERVQLVAPQGTVWNGSAQLVLGAGPGSRTPTALPGRIQWQLRLGLGGLTLVLRADCCLQQDWVWTAHPEWNGVRVSLSDLPAAQPAHWPSDVLAGLGTPWNTLQLQGRLALSSQALTLQWQAGTWQVTGQAQLEAREMSSSLSTLKPLGSYRLTLAGGTAPALRLSTLDGALQLHGAGQWTQGHLQFNGEASAVPERREALAHLLNLIGRREGARSIITVG